jgi:protease-4
MRKRDVVLLAIMAIFVLVFVAALVGGIGSGIGGDDGFSLTGFGDRVALVEIRGEISSSDWAVRQIRHYAEQDNVSAMVIRLDSPGGGVAASQEIFEEIGKAREQGKKIVASMGSIAASGAYYIACGVDTVVANPGSLTGSIGVIFQWPVFENLMDKVGVRLETIRSGEFKDVGNPGRSITPREQEMLQSVIDDTYNQFVDVVAEGRAIDRDSVLAFATGAIFTGQQALELGLVDVLGDYQDAVDIAGEMAGIGPDPATIRQVKRKRVGIWDLLGSFLGSDLGVGRMISGPRLAYLFSY